MASAKYQELLERLPQVAKPWKAALYIRLSREDGDKVESNSITSQREILKEYLKLHPDIELHDFYIDDGWSGTNFDRPGFIRMMEDIYSGDVNCVIVKDLSRFGRNYTDAGNYLDNIFVRLQIRFIALNNGIDTATNNMNAATRCITVGVQNVINESLAATTSVNVRGTLNVNREQGKFIGSFASYGYMKDPNDHHKLIIDPETAPVVRMIFEKFIDGCSIIGIAKDLNEMGIPNPTAYKKLKGFNYKHPAGKKLDGLWPDSSVRRILRNEMYVGNMVQGKNTTISYKIKQCRAIPKEDWIIVEGTHEAIVDRETFDKAQSLFNQFIRKAPQKSEVDLFSGFVRCADCLRAMNKKTNSHPYGTYHYYRCGTSRKMKKSSCTNHTIRIDKMELAVLASIQGMIDSAVEMDKLIKRINSSPVKKKESSHICSAIDTHTAELEKLKGMIIDLYPDWKSGIISKEEYFTLKEQLTEKTTSLEKALENLKRTNEEFKNGITEDNDFISHFKKYGKIDTLTRAMVVELIDKIYVHEGGRITISFKFTDAYEKALEYIELNKEAILTA
ncbi:recombinase family protein [Oscillibacter valericigenes]|jgi:site-specific DNA recombinase|uniref:recombinase family protein n=1 Tax=Oscillospiraceae TaxID=216572 RepID=UPI001F38D7CD|nr:MULTISPECIES: recombinase family protein [Oscillospiraceae]MDD7543270.1 recombinase family protein [Peptoniphilaceae bacterium]MDU1323754.1 recombinase family protein [Clostridiales bacterium]MCF2617123.1 recombinase family protein [Oscillibacter valericigenes]MCI6053808.1 recombinase family protein [Dysosmobacter sp.]MDY5766169.1 recombinase family protein [Peptoniphilaceae bacterium]